MASGGESARFGVLALTQGNAKVALVRHGDAWGFPSLPLPRQAGSLEDELETALDAAEQQLGLDLTDTMCSQPVIQALGPGPRETTKFFVALNVPEASLAPSSSAGGAGQAQEAAAAWRDLQALLGETAGSAVAGNQLVSVLRQLQAMMTRRFEMVMPADDGYQEVAALLAWHEAGMRAPWRGPDPKQFLEAHCAAHQLPAPCFNVFERDRTPARTHFCATAMLPHLGLQLTPDAVYPSPVDAMQNAALLALLYMEGALGPDCPLVTFAAAGEMAQLPHAFVTEHELRQDARAASGVADRTAQHAAEEAQRQCGAGGGHPAAAAAQQQQQQQLGVPTAPAGAAAGAAAGERPLKRPKPEKGPLTIPQALAQVAPDKHPLMAIKELCDKCRFPQPRFEELPVGPPAPGGARATAVACSLPQAGVPRTVGPALPDAKAAKAAAAQLVMDAVRRQHPAAPAAT